jgi:hypothetical protein
MGKIKNRMKGGSGRSLVKRAMIHEIGHCTGFFLLGESIQCVRVIDTPDKTKGRCYGVKAGQQDLKDASREDIEHDIMVSMAGDICLEHFGLRLPENTGGEGEHGLSWDEVKIVEEATSITKSYEECLALLNSLYERIVDLMNNPSVWRFVNIMVRELQAARTQEGRNTVYTLTGDQTKAIWETTQ